MIQMAGVPAYNWVSEHRVLELYLQIVAGTGRLGYNGRFIPKGQFVMSTCFTRRAVSWAVTPCRLTQRSRPARMP